MLNVLKSPLPPFHIALAGMALVATSALFCLAYTHLAGQPESFAEAVRWGVVNLLPWLLAFEAAKRSPSWPAKCAILAAAMLVSLALQQVPEPRPDAVAFEFVRRLPSLAFVAALLAIAALPGPKTRGETKQQSPFVQVADVDWISAAGNYVELHGNGRRRIERASLSALEEYLAGQGFIRIHRSLLVRRDCIARVRRHDLILSDRTVLKIGKRYRDRLPAI